MGAPVKLLCTSDPVVVVVLIYVIVVAVVVLCRLLCTLFVRDLPSRERPVLEALAAATPYHCSALHKTLLFIIGVHASDGAVGFGRGTAASRRKK